MKEQITELNHPSIYAWFKEYNYDYENTLGNSNNGLKDGKLEFKDNYHFKESLEYIKYPFNVTDYFDIANTNTMFLINSPIEIQKDFQSFNSPNLLSFKGFPKGVVSDVGVYYNIEQYSLKHKELDKYKIYLGMWLEMLDSVTEEERWDYINEYKGKTDEGYSVVPNEILLEFGVL